MSSELLYPAMVGISLAAFCLALPVVVPVARKWLDWRTQYYATCLDRLHKFDDRPVNYVALELVAALGAAGALYALFGAPVFSFIGLIVGALVPTALVRKQMQQRRENLEKQFPDALLSLSSSVRAGLSLAQAIEQVAGDMPAPVGQEFALISRQYGAGVPLDEVLRMGQQRLASRHFNLITSALIVNRERGGDVSEILERIASSLREIYRLEEKIRTETSAPRFEGRIMLFVPPFVLLMLHTVQPELVNSMFYSLSGIIMLMIAAGLMIVAFFWIQKIVSEDI